jgi:hypothetical protein
MVEIDARGRVERRRHPIEKRGCCVNIARLGERASEIGEGSALQWTAKGANQVGGLLLLVRGNEPSDGKHLIAQPDETGFGLPLRLFNICRSGILDVIDGIGLCQNVQPVLAGKRCSVAAQRLLQQTAACRLALTGDPVGTGR